MTPDKEAMAMSRELDDFLNNLIDQDRLRPMDMFLFVMNLLTRLRAYFTVQDLMQTLWGGVKRNEIALQQGAAVKHPETGESINLLLAEERHYLGTEKLELPDTIPEEWLDDESLDTVPEEWTDDA